MPSDPKGIRVYFYFLDKYEGFAEPLENRRFSDQAPHRKQNLDSLSYATEGCSVEDPKGVRAFQALYPKGVRAFQALYPKGPLTRIPYGSEGLSGPQPGTPWKGVQRNPTTNKCPFYTFSHLAWENFCSKTYRITAWFRDSLSRIFKLRKENPTTNVKVLRAPEVP